VKAVVYEGPRQVSVKDVPDARIERPTGGWFGHENLGAVVDVGQGVDAPRAYEHFDKRDDDSTKVVLHPAMAGA
jgi:glutathione-independent formaldehyde dehydrogenase